MAGLLHGEPAVHLTAVGVVDRVDDAEQAAHPAYSQSLERLRDMSVLIGSYEPHKPKAGGGADQYRWEEVLELLTPKLSAPA